MYETNEDKIDFRAIKRRIKSYPRYKLPRKDAAILLAQQIKISKARKERQRHKDLNRVYYANKNLLKEPKPKVEKTDLVLTEKYMDNDTPSPYSLIMSGGSIWDALEKSWTGYRIGKVQAPYDYEAEKLQKTYAVLIQKFADMLNLPVEDFTNIGLSPDGFKDPKYVKQFINPYEVLGDDI